MSTPRRAFLERTKHFAQNSRRKSENTAILGQCQTDQGQTQQGDRCELIFCLQDSIDVVFEQLYEAFSKLIVEVQSEWHIFKYTQSFCIVTEEKDYESIMGHYHGRRIAFNNVESCLQVRKAFPRRIPEQNIENIAGYAIPSASQLVMDQSGQLLRQSSRRWNLEDIQVPQAHSIATGNNVNVAVIDTGIDYTHPELSERFSEDKGVSFVGGSVMDQNSHGTHVAGIIAGQSTGVAPSCNLYAVKVLDASGAGSEVSVIKGIEWCIDNSIDVANMSLGSSYSSQIELQVCKAALKNGVSLVAAAGNSCYGDEYPASYPGVVSVAAVDENNSHPRFSNISDKLDISAPGVMIYSTIPDTGYSYMTGTSMASPHVAGVLALLCSHFSGDPDSYQNCIKKTAKELGKPPNNKSKFGYGLVQSYNALTRGGTNEEQ